MRRSRARISILLLVLAAAPAGGQTIVTSAGPDHVDVTLYRAPGRGFNSAMDVEWLNGYALISETRRVAMPAGESEIRFEGVAGGMLPQSAIVSGFPDGIVERNRDAYLLSPESLLDRSLGRRIHLRRTSLATGAVTEQDAVIRSGADGAVVLQTAEGFEALRCTGLPETPVFAGVPAGLSARPTLSVRTRASRPVTATVTLAYLSSGFDWQANYVATLSSDGTRVDLFAWLVLASGDETSFRNADTQAVAGRINREYVEEERRDPGEGRLDLRCWPQARTSDILEEARLRQGQPVTVVNSEEIRLQGTMRTEDLVNSLPALRARQEELGDLKLYRIPEPVTVAAHSTKQVAFLEQAGVPVRIAYRQMFFAGEGHAPAPANRFLLARNRPEEGLGMPLPGGRVQLFTNAGGRPILIGEGVVDDRAVGEDVEIEVGAGPAVIGRSELTDRSGRRRDFLLTVTNDQSAPIRYEAEFYLGDGERFEPRGIRLGTRNGRPLWTVTVPANGTATLRYRVTELRS
jgi:hypothetical protein